ncbi:unnamed protein product [Polarella glacialis]|uniref:Uncharacterized protein n=3 Tax=Polarella glacialis TaxID=89957 RepID=A0A813ICM4_POLGL|nr:unnamed protein product [Polarella glacialis]
MMAAASTPAASSSSPPTGNMMAGSDRSAQRKDSEPMVWAYYNPFFAKWQRLPEGFEPPGSMDLTAFHKKRTDSVEWSRLFAEGKLTEIIPRGGLTVRYRPAWDTHEPILVKDAQTGKTIQWHDKMERRGKKKECEVKF